jgi:hypothetical protein
MRIIVAVTLGLLVGCSREPKSQPKPEPAQSAALVSRPDAGGQLANGPAAPRPEAGVQAVDAGPPPEFVGVVRGIVRLAKGVPVPLAPVPKMGNGQLDATTTPPCPALDVSDRQTIRRADKGGGLSPVHLAITGMSDVPKRSPKVHELFLDACRLRPVLLGAMRGDTVRVTNRSDMPLLPLLPGDKFMTGMLRNEQREFELTIKGSMPIRCNFGNYCGETTIVSLSHPFYAVTDAEGHFVIEQVPLDQELQIHAWHPLLNVKTVTLKLTKDEREKTIELTVEPTPAALATTRAGSAASPTAAPGDAKPTKKVKPKTP